MKPILFILIILFTISLFSCQTPSDVNESNLDSTESIGTVYPNTKTFYQIDSIKDRALVVAESIIYDVIVSPKAENDWSEYQTKSTDAEAIKNVIFQAIYQGRLTPYSYKDDEYFGTENLGKVIPIKEIKAFEKKFQNSKLGKIQFTEEWYFDEKNLKMGKKVNSIIFGFEVFNNEGLSIRFEALFKVYLDNKEKNRN